MSTAKAFRLGGSEPSPKRARIPTILEVESRLFQEESSPLRVAKEEYDVDCENVLSNKAKLDMALLFKSLNGDVKLDLDMLNGLNGPTDVSSFTAEQTLTLIECVRSQPPLWDPASGVSQKTKRDTWAQVATMMEEKGLPVDSRLCCSKFRILRDSYMRIIRKSAAKGTPVNERGRSWQFFDALRFLGDGNGGPIGNGDDRGTSMTPEEECIDGGELSQSYNDILLSAVASTESASTNGDKVETESIEASASSSKAGSQDRQTDSPALSLNGTSSSKVVSSKKLPPGSRLHSVVAGLTKQKEEALGDTWCSFGEHVADVLRELSRLDEDEAWQLRLNMETVLLESSKKVREGRKRVRDE